MDSYTLLFVNNLAGETPTHLKKGRLAPLFKSQICVSLYNETCNNLKTPLDDKLCVQWVNGGGRSAPDDVC